MPATLTVVVETANETVRSRLVGDLAVSVARPAGALFEAGGKNILSEGARESGREMIEEGVRSALQRTAPTLASKYFPKGGARLLPGPAAAGAAAMGVGTALGRVVSVAGRAGVVSGLVDGGFAAVRGAVAVRRGEMTGREVGTLVLKEAGTGAAAGAVGVSLTVAAATTLGPMAAPVMAGIGIVGSIATKFALGAATA